LFLGFFVAFAIKAPLVPFHTWLPDTASQATPATSTMLIGVLDKIGTFGMLLIALPLFGEASSFFAPAIIVLAVVSILYGALLAIGQNDLLRLIAYTSVSHFGFIVLGIYVFTRPGTSGSAVYMVSHGLTTAMWLLLTGFLISRRGTQLIAGYGGVRQVAPVLAGLYLVAGLAALSLPGLASFVGEFLVLVGTFEVSVWAAAFATLGIVLAAVYVLWTYQRIFTGAAGTAVSAMRDLGRREIAAMVPLVVLLVLLGVAPQPLLDTVNPTVDAVLTAVDKTDPPPTLSGAAAGAEASVPAEGIVP